MKAVGSFPAYFQMARSLIPGTAGFIGTDLVGSHRAEFTRRASRADSCQET